MKKILPACALGAAALLALSACGGGGDEEAETEAGGVQLVNAGTLTLCSDIPYEPFEFVQDGENVGLDIDLAQATADDLGVELEVITTAFEAIQSGSALDTDQCDIALSGMTITEERASQMDFSKPYLKDNLALMTKKDSDITSIEDLQGEKAGVQQATTGEAYATDNGVEPVQFEDAGLMTQGIQSGQVDAVIANISTIYAATEADDSLTLVEEYDTGEVIGAAVKMGNTALLEQFETTMTDLRETGEYDDLVDQWFGEVADAARLSQEEADAAS
ncbi:MAG TPA: ABC transporter substrate-binding protein [Brevibacterium senegalense]|uniref:ABC transporter substrate-binding protein n=1 Tax=Brevibacterium senegalense TaxID=1033736 RepID=A0A921MEK6_9MICO|nr:ABC transporter substrate-binding protein [Brevibacterium senegalense]